MIFIRKSKESPSLSNHLTCMVREYQTQRNRNPKVIRLPIWRQHELEQDVEEFAGFKPMSGSVKAFNGILVLYIVGRDWIELE